MPRKNFFDLDDAEADAFLASFVDRAGPRLARFKEEVAMRGGPPVEALDGSLESLPKVWSWFVEHVGVSRPGFDGDF